MTKENNDRLKTGKLDSKLLEEIVFQHISYRKPEVLTRPGIGEDCAVIDFSPWECVLSTDPITAAAEEIGRLAVHISCNDIASNGIAPLGIMLAVLLPEGTTAQQIDIIMKQAAEAAADLEVEIIGGHTEITAAVTKPVIISTAVGRAPMSASQKAENMRPGDLICITKQAGLEGTGIIATDHRDALTELLSEAELSEAVDMLEQVSVVREGVLAGRVGTAGMHDITEGGVLGAVWEMCSIAGLGAEIEEERIPVAAVTRKICAHLGINALRLISSGSMMIIVRPDRMETMARAMEEAGIPFTRIGVVREKKAGVVLARGGMLSEIAPPKADEIYQVDSESRQESAGSKPIVAR